jgi:hypothetical protein
MKRTRSKNDSSCFEQTLSLKSIQNRSKCLKNTVCCALLG